MADVWIARVFAIVGCPRVRSSDGTAICALESHIQFTNTWMVCSAIHRVLQLGQSGGLLLFQRRPVACTRELAHHGFRMLAPMTPSEAFAAICLAAVGCDSRMDKEEAQMLRSQLASLAPFNQLSEQELVLLFDRLLTQLRQLGWSALIATAVPSLTAAQQELVLAQSAHLVRANRDVSPVEEAFLQDLAAQLTLAPQRCAQILEVMAILHRKSLG